MLSEDYPLFLSLTLIIDSYNEKVMLRRINLCLPIDQSGHNLVNIFGGDGTMFSIIESGKVKARSVQCMSLNRNVSRQTTKSLGKMPPKSLLGGIFIVTFDITT